LALSCLLAYASTAPAQDGAPDLAWIDRQALAAGDVVVQTGKTAPKVVSVDVAVLIGAPASTIWSVLTSCEIAPEYVPHVADCTLVETFNDGRSQVFRQTVKPAFFIPAFEHVFRLDYEPFERIEVSRIGGMIEHMMGSWWLLERGDGRILLVHHLEIDPGLPVPRFLVRSALRRDLPKVLRAVRDRAEAGA
jgi:hypothetical protein